MRRTPAASAALARRGPPGPPGVATESDRNGDALEIVVVVVLARLVMRGAGGEVGFGRGAEAEQHGRIDLAVGGLDHLHGARQVRVDLGQHPARGRPASIWSVLLSRMRSAQRSWSSNTSSSGLSCSTDASAARCAARASGSSAKAPGGDRRPVDHRDDAVHRDAGADRRPVEGGDERLRQGEARGLDQDVLGRVRPVEERVQGRHEIVGDGAADAAVRQLDDVLLRAARDAAAFDEGAVEAEIAELVDEHREPAPAGVLEEVAHQRRLAGAEKAGDDGAGDLGEVAHGGFLVAVRPQSLARRGGMRATTPLRKASGRSRQGTRPSAVAA